MQHHLQASQWEALARFRVESVPGFRVLDFRVLRSSVQGLMLQSSRVFSLGLGRCCLRDLGLFRAVALVVYVPKDSGFRVLG